MGIAAILLAVAIGLLVVFLVRERLRGAGGHTRVSGPEGGGTRDATSSK